MTAFLAPLLLAMQVGPAPTPIELEPLPIPRRGEAGPAQQAAPTGHEAEAVAAAIEGNRAILARDYRGALAEFDAAQRHALAAGLPRLAAEIGLDRSRALMLLGRNDEARHQLVEVREALPGNAAAWVNSAIAARKAGDLGEAQRLIEEASMFAPGDPSVGLEAGTIALYSGRQDAARMSWQSVVDLAPDSDEAILAREYLELTAPAGE